MQSRRRLSDETGRVLQLFVDDPTLELFGLEIIRLAGLKSGSLYPILHRLEERNILLSRWEDLDEAVAAKRRPRRHYRLNTANADEAAALLSEWSTPRGSSPARRSRPRVIPA